MTNRELIALMAAALYPDKASRKWDEGMESLSVNRAMRILAEVDTRHPAGAANHEIGRRAWDRPSG